MKEEKRILADPEPQTAVSELADSSVNLIVRPWVRKEDYGSVKLDLLRKIKEAFEQDDIETPFPQRVVHMVSAK
jgi:small conductance mechanosensitive channel